MCNMLKTASASLLLVGAFTLLPTQALAQSTGRWEQSPAHVYTRGAVTYYYYTNQDGSWTVWGYSRDEGSWTRFQYSAKSGYSSGERYFYPTASGASTAASSSGERYFYSPRPSAGLGSPWQNSPRPSYRDRNYGSEPNLWDY